MSILFVSAELEYERCEDAYLGALKAAAPRDQLAQRAGELAAAAAALNSLAYERFHACTDDERRQLDLLTERTEVLSELWSDVRDAYGMAP